MALARLMMVSALVAIGSSVYGMSNDPEKKVEISIYDLLDKRLDRRPRAASDSVSKLYVERVIAEIQGQKDKIFACLDSDTNFNVRYRLEIRNDGTANAESVSGPSENSASLCVEEVLRQAQFPAHRHSKAVAIEIPLKLVRRRL